MSDELMVGDMFERWNAGTAEIFKELASLKSLVDPFRLGETAGVSILAAGAARVGFTPVAEVVVKKYPAGTSEDKAFWNGRSDLILAAENAVHMFEFKLCWKDASDQQIEECLVLASADAACLAPSLCSSRYGGIISSFTSKTVRNRYREFANADNRMIVSNDDACEGLAFLFRKVA